MGNPSNALVETIHHLIRQLADDIKGRKYFELGDQPTPLGEIETSTAYIHKLLQELDPDYSHRSMTEQNYYYAALGAAKESLKFLESVRLEPRGSEGKTASFLRHLDKLEQAVSALLDRVPQDSPVEIPPQSVLRSAQAQGETEKNTAAARSAIQYESQVFISYAWGEPYEGIVNQIDQTLHARGIMIIRDKRDLPFKGSISEFMKRIGRGNCVIAVISDKYLRSENCMFELVEIAESKRFADRIFPVILSDAKIFKPIERLEYVQHWENETEKLNEKMKSLRDQSNLQGIREDLDKYARFRTEISKLTSTLKDMNALTPEKHQESNFSELYEAIERRMRLA